MCDKDELHLLGHLLDDVAEARDVGVVERRVDLVQQAEGRRIKLEDREHERYRGQRLLPTRQQVNRAVALSWRPRHDGDTRRQQVLPGKLQVGMAAAEEFREETLEAGIDLFVGLAKPGSRFAVDAADSTLERFEGIVQVGEL